VAAIGFEPTTKDKVIRDVGMFFRKYLHLRSKILDKKISIYYIKIRKLYRRLK